MTKNHWGEKGSAIESEKKIREQIDKLLSEGRTMLALDIIQDLEVSLLRKVYIDKFFKSSYAAKKSNDWEDLSDLVDKIAAKARPLSHRWREVLFDQILEKVVKGECNADENDSS